MRDKCPVLQCIMSEFTENSVEMDALSAEIIFGRCSGLVNGFWMKVDRVLMIIG